MQFLLTFHPTTDFSLPLSYHSIVQGTIYNILSKNPTYSTFLHDKGFEANTHAFKLFVFSLLEGPFQVKDKSIYFTDDFTLEIRSPMQEFCNILAASLLDTDSVTFGHTQANLVDISIRKEKITQSEIRITTASPICLSTTYYDEAKKRKTRYLQPTDPDFNHALNHNFESKLLAAENRKPYSKIECLPSLKDSATLPSNWKYLTRFANRTIIEAWRGFYTLSGDPRDLQFLYDTGLGSRNSQGFGMIRLL